MNKTFKQLTTGLALIASAVAFSQVGIQTETPQATLDVVGAPADATKLDGIIAPRLEGAQLRAKTYTSSQTGALVYVTMADTAPSGQTEDVTAEGYYYFNGTKWVIAGAGDAVNIYNADGALTGERMLDINGEELTFKGSKRNTYWDSDGRIHQESNDPSSDAVMGFHGGNNSNLFIQQWSDANAAITASGNSTGLLLTTHYTNDPAPITFNTSPGGNTMGLERMRITGEGSVGIQTNIPSATLDVTGAPADVTKFDGIIAPRITGAQLRAKTYTVDQTAALVYVTAADTAPSGQTEDVTSEGYYYFNGTKWVIAGAADMVNIYNSDGTLTDDRVVTMNSNLLRFSGTDGTMKIDNDGESEFLINAINSNTARVRLGAGTSELQIATNPDGNIDFSGKPGGNSSLAFGTPGSASVSSKLAFYTVGTTRMTIDGIGNVGINTPAATEKLHVNGITRLQGLPLNGTANSIYTQSNGTASSTQNQTFTATRTVVADANGVLGYVTGLPNNENIYNANGSLTGSRTLTLAGRMLEFIGAAQTTQWSSSGALWQNGTSRASIYLAAGTDSRLNFQIDPNSNGLISATGNATSLVISTNGTAASAPITFSTSAGSNATGTEKMRITGEGNLGIGTSAPGVRFHVVKAATDLTPAIIQGCNIYADNSAATAAGLPVGGLYRKADGVLMVRY